MTRKGSKKHQSRERSVRANAPGGSERTEGSPGDAPAETAPRPGSRLVGRPGSTDPEVREPSRPEDRERLIAQALAHAEARDALYWRPRAPSPGRWKLPVALAVFCLAAYVASVPPDWAQPVNVVRAITPDELERGARMALQLQAQEVEAFRAVHQRLPETLAELPVQLEDVRWIRSSSRVYQLVTVTPDGRTIVYDSARPAAEFRVAERELAELARMAPPRAP